MVSKQNEILGQDEALKVLELAVKQDIAALLVGDTGTGKTTMVKHLADLHGKEWVRFNLTGETTVDDFVGKWTLNEGETVWNDGILLQAMRQGKWLILDEVNVALPEILFVLHSLLDDDKFVVVPNNQGEVVRPAEGFRFFATMNPVDEYAGTKDLNKAFKSRFGVIATINYPISDVEIDILVQKAEVSPSIATKMVLLANELRTQKKKDQIFYTCSTRDLMQWAEAYKGLDDLSLAFKYTILNKANGDSEKIAEVYKMVTGEFIKMEEDVPGVTLAGLKSEHAKLIKERESYKKQSAQITKDILTDIRKKLAAELK